jgi:hypothetical protein
MHVSRRGLTCLSQGAVFAPRGGCPLGTGLGTGLSPVCPYSRRLSAQPALRIATRTNTVPSPAAVAAVPAIVYCSRPCGNGMSRSSHTASTTNTSNPPVATNAASLNFSLTTPF